MDAKVAVGVDVGKSFHYVWARDLATGDVIYKGQVKNTEADIEEALYRCGDPQVSAVITDQPNSIGSLLVRLAIRLGYECFYIPSEAMRREAARQGKTSKTDKVDAEVICTSFTEAPKLLHPVAEDATRAKISVLRSRDKDLMADETRAVNRLRAALVEVMPEFEAALHDERIRSRFMLEALVKFSGPWSMKAHLRAFEGFSKRYSGKVPEGLIPEVFDVLDRVKHAPKGTPEIEGLFCGAIAKDILRIQDERLTIEAKIDELLENDIDYQNLLTMPGIGKKTAATIVAEIDITRFRSPFALGRYSGVAPKVDRSGSSIDKKFCDCRGNSRLRHAMFTSSFASLKTDPYAYEFYCKKRAEGKTFAAAILALARKRIKVIYAMLRDKTAYGAHLMKKAQA